MDPEHMISMTHAYFRGLEASDTDGFVSLFSPTVHFEDPVGSHVLNGHAGVAAFHKGLHKAWARIQISALEIIPRGNRVAVRWGADGGSATGKDITFGGMNVIEFDESGKISRLEGYWDLEGVIAQM